MGRHGKQKKTADSGNVAASINSAFDFRRKHLNNLPWRYDADWDFYYADNVPENKFKKLEKAFPEHAEFLRVDLADKSAAPPPHINWAERLVSRETKTGTYGQNYRIELRGDDFRRLGLTLNHQEAVELPDM